MKAVIFAGGFGTRLTEETGVRPKPMVELAGRPMLWHVMKIYANHGITDFVILGGYRVEFIRQYFLNYRAYLSDFTIELATGAVEWRDGPPERWRVTVLDTGLETMTGGRLKRAQEVIGNETFCLTYGDGVADIDITALVAHHRTKAKTCTVTAVAPPGRFGVLGLSADGQDVLAFREKDQGDTGLINGGFFVCEPEIFDLLGQDSGPLEQEPMNHLVARGQLTAFQHRGFWQAMDTLRDKQVLEAVCARGAPWLKGGN